MTGPNSFRKFRQVDYSHWNWFPALDFEQCLKLLLRVDPNDNIRDQKPSVRDRYEQLWELVESCRDAGTLIGRYPYRQDIEPARFIEWAKSIGEDIPIEWKPNSATEPMVPQLDDVNWTVETAIADDLLTRIEATYHDRPDKKFGLQRVYDFLIRESQDACLPPSEYGIDLYRYWIEDDIEDKRTELYSVGKKNGLKHIRIMYEERIGSEVLNIPFRKFMDAFSAIKKRRTDNALGK